MIDSSIFPSSWDLNLFQDGSLLEVGNFSCEQDLDSSSQSSCSTPYFDLCSNASDYDSLMLDELEQILPISDQFVSDILEETTSGFSDLDLLSLAESSVQSSTSSINSNNTYVIDSPLEYLSTVKLWSKMSTAEQLETLHVLSEIVTYHMGIREQVEIIRIIDPSAIISPDDKEYALDSSFLNDKKLARIKSFVLQHQSNISKLHVNSKKRSRKAENISYSRTKRKPKKQINIEDVKLKNKRLKQTRKERKSGFFVYEKKMKLFNPLEEDEDVNVLE